MIEVLVGTIASGKSTWSSKMAKDGWIIINDDDIVNAIHGGHYAYKEELKPLYKSIETHIFHAAVMLNKNIIIDKGLNLTKESRRRWIGLAKSLDQDIRARVFNFVSPEVHAERRMASDPRGFSYDQWFNIAKSHFDRFEYPTTEEGFTSIEQYHEDQEKIAMKKLEMLNIVNEKVQTCEQCDLHKTRTKVVFGEGKTNSKLVFIGEAPGRDEDISGTPFCGRSGKLLTNILVACGISRDSVYICNILKCRPPNNRVPEDQEVEKCKKYVEMQLKIIQPSYIICLGATAAQRLLGESEPISALRGRQFNYHGAKVIATFHPSYALRNQEAKHEIYKDIMSVLEELKPSAKPLLD